VEIAGIAVGAMAAEYGTPLYVVDEADARGRALEIRESFDREFARVGSSAKVYYAGKAFLTTEVARWMIAAGLNIDVCSGGELAVALAAGVDPARIGLHGNNKSVAEIERAVSVGIGAIVLDSLIEIERVATAAARHGRVQPVRLRINSGVHASTHEYLATAREDQKFGIPLADVEGVVAIIRSHPELEFLGLHSHIGSQIFESDGFAEAARRLFAVHATLLETGPVPELNLGGGFGIAYTSVDVPLSIDEMARRFADIVSEAAAERGVPVPIVAVEPGRAIIGPSTATIYEVGTVKDVVVTVGPSSPSSPSRASGIPVPEVLEGSPASDTSVPEVLEGPTASGPAVPEALEGSPASGIPVPEVLEGSPASDTSVPEVLEGSPASGIAVPDETAIRRYVSIDGGMSDNIRAALYHADYSVRIVSRASDAEPALVRIAGKHCESGDIVVHADYLPGDVRPGDLVAVPATGAYHWSMASNYNYLGRPAVVAVNDGAAHLLVRRETEEDLLSRDAGLDRATETP
jgi:diaminopimelate decarboxylase